MKLFSTACSLPSLALLAAFLTLSLLFTSPLPRLRATILNQIHVQAASFPSWIPSHLKTYEDSTHTPTALTYGLSIPDASHSSAAHDSHSSLIHESSTPHPPNSSLTHESSTSDPSNSTLTFDYSTADTSNSSITHESSTPDPSKSTLTFDYSTADTSNSSLTYDPTIVDPANSSLTSEASTADPSNSSITYGPSIVDPSNSSLTYAVSIVNASDSSLTYEPSISSRTVSESSTPPDNIKHDVNLTSDQDPTETITTVAAEKCDLFNGNWVYDDQGPLYQNGSCPVLSQPQNCQGNGRPDVGYMYYRWKPQACYLPRFDPHEFLRMMQGKTLAFVGDSVARNQMESLMCILWQAETPESHGNRKMQRWIFRSHSVTIIRIWSSWLVHISNDAFQFAPQDLTKLHLEETDENFMNFIPNIHVLVLSSGHWFTKKTAFILGGEVVGGQLWWDKSHTQKLQSVDAFAISMKTALKGIVSHPDYKGLTILRTFSPDHYEGGAWNTGGSCTGKTRPLSPSELVFNAHTELMRNHQLEAFREAEKNISNASKLKLLDITHAFSYRADGHPGPYRSPDPNKITHRGPRGQPPPQDCLHWCMPGPIDTWNELLMEMIRQELQQ